MTDRIALGRTVFKYFLPQSEWTWIDRFYRPVLDVILHRAGRGGHASTIGSPASRAGVGRKTSTNGLINWLCSVIFFRIRRPAASVIKITNLR